MILNWWQKLIDNLYDAFMLKIEFYAPKIIGALTILLFWLLIAIVIYKIVIYGFKKFKIIALIDTLEEKMDLDLWTTADEDKEKDEKALENEKSLTNEKVKTKVTPIKIKRKKLTEKFNVDVLTAKSFSYYAFLISFRYSVVFIWLRDIEIFLTQLLGYLPNIFIAVCVWFFWIRFSETVYDVVYYTLDLTKHQTSRVIAMWSKIIILVCTVIIILNNLKIDIIGDFILNTFFVWFIATVSIWTWLAFWLWGKDVARDILESFRK